MLFATPALAAETGPQKVVGTLHEALLSVMKQADTLGYEGRYALLEPVLDAVFDTSFMAQKSIGRHWKGAPEEVQVRLLATFHRFTVANYAGRFNGYSGQHFETLGESPSTHGTVLVESRLVDPTGDPVQLNYRLRQVDGEWKIIDVFLNGTVSELALRRSEYSSLIRREGFEALIAALDEKISKLQSGSAPADQS
jgi:phospholipid transport system substrate-binding protein